MGATLFVLGVAASACSLSHSSTPTTTTLPGQPKAIVGVVTLIGSGSNVGNGTQIAALVLRPELPSSISRIAVGSFPSAVAIVPSPRDLALVANYSANTVSVINLRSGKVERQISAGAGPAGIAVAPDGKMAYVTDAGSSPIGDTVTPIDLTKLKALAPITVGDGPEGIAIDPNGEMAYVANSGAVVSGQQGAVGHTVTPIDLSTRRALAPISVGNAPEAIAMAPDGSSVYVANASSGSVTPIAIPSDTPGVPIPVEGTPQAIQVSPDSSTVYVANASSAIVKTNNVTVINAATDTAGKPIPVGTNPTGISIEGSTAWVVCQGAGEVVKINLKSETVLASATVALSGGPYAIGLWDVSEASIPSYLQQKVISQKAPSKKKS